ncbi:uncharacterized protein LOC141909822 [Tubulanus polymorphus]|uniref:uncharacterized protein LOC141909822 n=1 Tax=Tubulanus polymorphus TaxID=672921 RepID=UPI003DA3A67E
MSQEELFSDLPIVWLELNFDLDETPPWLASASGETENKISIDEVLSEIVNFSRQYATASATNDARNKILKAMKDEFIYRMAVEEDVGLQDAAQSREIINSNDALHARKSRRPREQETVNMYQALEHFTDKFTEMESTGLLDEEYVLEGHQILMRDTSHPNGGKFSQFKRTTYYDGEVHEYPDPKTIAPAHAAIIDQANELMTHISATYDRYSPDRVLSTVKLASWLLFNYVSLHPFGDGNGRMCRLLCSYVLSTLAPFPTPIYNIHAASRKSDYIDSIVATRKSESRRPVLLATMLLECFWKSWRHLHQKLTEI